MAQRKLETVTPCTLGTPVFLRETPPRKLRTALDEMDMGDDQNYQQLGQGRQVLFIIYHSRVSTLP